MNISMTDVMEIVNTIIDTAIERNDKYANSIINMYDFSVYQQVNMKLDRTITLLSELYKKNKKIDSKWYDEILDCVNYLAYTIIRKNKGHNRFGEDTYENIVKLSQDKTYITRTEYNIVIKDIMNNSNSVDTNINVVDIIKQAHKTIYDMSCKMYRDHEYIDYYDTVERVIYSLLVSLYKLKKLMPLPSVTQGKHN